MLQENDFEQQKEEYKIEENIGNTEMFEQEIGRKGNGNENSREDSRENCNESFDEDSRENCNESFDEDSRENCNESFDEDSRENCNESFDEDSRESCNESCNESFKENSRVNCNESFDESFDEDSRKNSNEKSSKDSNRTSNKKSSKDNDDNRSRNIDENIQENEQIREMGQVTLNRNGQRHRIELLTIIGEVEGHESAPSQSKTTKYEHILPKLALIEDDENVDGLLILLNTVGGDVEAGLAIAEMIASLSIPTVSLVLGGGHSIGVPMAVSADYSFIVQSATMVIHPVRSSGMFIGVAQTYRNMEKIQDRITSFVSEHSGVKKERLEQLMLDTTQLVKDVGTMLEGPEAVKEGLIDEVGGIREAMKKLHELINENFYS